MSSPVLSRDHSFDAGAIRYDASRITQPGVGLFDPLSPASHAAPVGQGGRQAAWFVSGEFGEGVLRHYRRGGLMARVSADRYVWTGAEETRSFAEFELLRGMHQQGLPVPRPIAAVYWRRGPTYRAAILVERLMGVKPLANMLDHGHQPAVAAAIFAMHEAGVWHADLNAYNILLDPQGTVWLIDFDKGRRQLLSLERRQANLLRLRRSLRKVRDAQGIAWWEELSIVYAQLARAKGLL
ncbi:MAG TPA: 3-deoxy-D-manno-octulosonic acid kinase [Candidimonas sp.]|nr:3-deoxy-D-manno-octulosonic acid kinase [Candidimonas sp.]